MGARTETVAINIDNCNMLLGRVSAETVSVYPPGIPLLVRGEVLRKGHLQLLMRLQAAVAAQGDGQASALLGKGCTVTGASDKMLNSIRLYRVQKQKRKE
jgi:arginine/lysine/ornithine decarboxylase